MNDLGKKIKDLREEKTLTPEQLAEQIGFAKSTISRSRLFVFK